MSGAQPSPAEPAIPAEPATPAEPAAPAQPASTAQPGLRWHFLFRPKWLGWHAFAICAVAGMLWLGDWQFHRAESGNSLSWAYTFEWPIFAVMGIVFWIKTILDEFKTPGTSDARASDVDLPAAAGGLGHRQPGTIAMRDEDDPELAAYNAYLARLNQEVKGHGRWHGLR